MNQSRNWTLGISQYINNQWVVLIELPSDGPQTEEQIQLAIKELTETIFGNDKIFLTSPKGSVIFNRSMGPIRLDLK